MQRYRVGFVNYTGNAVAMAIEAGDGDYCLYSDARAEINKAVEANNNAVLAVVSSEKRVKELEAALDAFYNAVHPVTHAITNEQLRRAQEDLVVFMANKPRAALESP